MCVIFVDKTNHRHQLTIRQVVLRISCLRNHTSIDSMEYIVQSIKNESSESWTIHILLINEYYSLLIVSAEIGYIYQVSILDIGFDIHRRTDKIVREQIDCSPILRSVIGCRTKVAFILIDLSCRKIKIRYILMSFIHHLDELFVCGVYITNTHHRLHNSLYKRVLVVVVAVVVVHNNRPFKL